MAAAGQDVGLGTASGSARNIPSHRTVTSRRANPASYAPTAPAPPTSGPRHRGRTPGHTTASLLIARLTPAAGTAPRPGRCTSTAGSCAPSTSGPVVPRITRRGSRKDVARWHVGLAFQVLDDCLDGKACHLPGGTGDSGEADVGESGQPRIVADDRDFLARRRRPLPDSPRTVHPQHRAERQRQQLIGGAGVAVGQRTSRPGLSAIKAAPARLT
jgi:hypothetical protein